MRNPTADGLTGLAAGDTAAAEFPVAHLQVKELSYAIDGKPLIDALNFQLPPNSLTVIMGPNGAGKSLLLRLLHGLIEPASGHILWGGQPMSADVRKRQAMVFQRPVLLRRSVASNIDFVLTGSGQERRIKCAQILEKAGLVAQADQPARLLSGGEQQRLALARAMALKPDILLLDEPTASLDPASIKAIEAAIFDAHAAGTKVIFVTHDLGQAKRIAGDILFLNAGRLEEFTPAERFFAGPQTDAARAFMDGQLLA